MSKSCNCFEETRNKAKEHIRAKLPEDIVDFSVSWKDSAIFFSGDHVPVNPSLEVTYRKIKKDKIPAKNLTKDSIGIMCSYCPFCGRKLGE